MTDLKEKSLLPRSPIVVVMGHVDHGKTTLLDYIRKANVAAREAGGITQSIGAYEIEHRTPNTEQSRRITFIDTPGHEAFSKMRTRGAHAADLAVLVIAADEGVKPQTKESFDILTATETPFVVAITKIDKPNADAERIKNELTAAGILLEGYGGHISYQPVSAKTGEHIDALLDLILLAADMEHLTYDPASFASGYVLETKVDRQRGLEATVILNDGTLRHGDWIGTSTAQGKIRILEDFAGKTAKTLTPSAPALIIGFERLPDVGDWFSTDPDAVLRASAIASKPGTAVVGSPDESAPFLRVSLKAADTGSLEALSQIVTSLPDAALLAVVARSVGDVNDNDIRFAASAGATVLAFKSRTDKGARMLAETQRVRVVSSEIVYELITTIETMLRELAAPKSAGELEILAVFNQEKLDKQIVGGKVVSGIFKNRSQFVIERAKVAIGTGFVSNLQQQKKETQQVAEGNEAGLLAKSEMKIEAGDRLVIKG